MRTDGEHDSGVPSSSARIWTIPPKSRHHFVWCPVACTSGIFRRRMCARNGSLHAPRSLLPSESAATVLPSRRNHRPGPQRCGWYAPGIPSGRCSPVNHLGRGPSHVASGGRTAGDRNGHPQSRTNEETFLSSGFYGKLVVALLSKRLASIGKTFPPGATSCRKRPTPSPWREFEFALHHVLAAITPRLPLDSVMRRWNQIAEALSEPSRNRRPQLESLF